MTARTLKVQKGLRFAAPLGLINLALPLLGFPIPKKSKWFGSPLRKLGHYCRRALD